MFEDKGLYSIGIMPDGYVYAIRPSEVAADDNIILDRINKFAWQDFENDPRGKAAIKSKDGNRIADEFFAFLPIWQNNFDETQESIGKMIKNNIHL